jgi:UDP-N-acetylmuramoyl-tripeptide--D-alanyl-D-alanine ligase
VLVIGVTGSVGKTSTKELIGDVLGRRFAVLRTPANLNTEIGVPMSLMDLTPQHDVAVIEMGMYDLGDIRLLAQIAQPQIGVVTNVQPSHLERLGTLERIAQAKSELVSELPPDGLAVLNVDDERTRAMAALSPCPTAYYGLRSDADVWADGIESHGLRGIEFNLHAGERSARAKMQLLGAQSVHAALAAVAVALRVGMSFDEAVGALRHVEGGVRILVCAGIRGSTILDDTYNANPASMLAALNLLGEMDGRRVAVLGDMLELGSYEDEGHRLVGQRAAATAHWLLTVGPRARSIATEARAAGMPPHAVEAFETLTEARDRLTSGLLPGDFVLVKGSRGVHLDELVSAIQVAA